MMERSCAFEGGARYFKKAAAYPSLYSGQALPKKYGEACPEFVEGDAWIQEQSADDGFTLLCVLGVGKIATHPQSEAGCVVKVAIITAVTQNRAVYGTRRLKKVLENQGECASRRRIGRLMQEAQLRGETKRRFRQPQTPNTIQLSHLTDWHASLTCSNPSKSTSVTSLIFRQREVGYI
jgi:hypothetical protein